MADTLKASVVTASRDSVPFLVITVIWVVVMLVMYVAFLLTIPSDVSYGNAVHASVFVPPLVAFAGHALRQALKVTSHDNEGESQ